MVSCEFWVIPTANASWRHCRASWHEATQNHHSQKTPMASLSASDYTNTLTGDWRQGRVSCTCTNWSAQSPEVGIPNEATHACFLPYASATLRYMRQRGRGISQNATGANFSARWTIVWWNHARGNDVVFTKLKIARHPNVGTRTR